VARIEEKGSAFGDIQVINTNLRTFDPRHTYGNPVYAQQDQAHQNKYLVDDGRPCYAQVPDGKGVWPDGAVYRRAGEIAAPKGLDRFGPDGKQPLAFGDSGSNGIVFNPAPSFTPWHPWRGMMVSRGGHVYSRYGYRPTGNWDGPIFMWIKHHGPDGKELGGLKDISSCTYGMGVDARGNIYIGHKPRPAGIAGPEDVEKALGDKVPRDSYGCVFKFGPAGGSFAWTKGEPKDKAERKNGDLFSPAPKVLDSDPYLSSRFSVEPRGAQWVYVGMSLLPTYHGCICRGSDLAVDPHGRVFLPDGVACRVAVLDTNGNRIRYIGGYGNMDSRGKGSPLPDPEIAFANIKMVTQASSRQVRVADDGNGWVSVINLGYEQEVKVPVAVAR